MFGFSCARLRRGRTRQRLALLLEPAGDRRIQRGSTRLRRRAACSTISASNRPAVVALQQRDWAPDVDDSAHFFMTTPALAGWLRANYDAVDRTRRLRHLAATERGACDDRMRPPDSPARGFAGWILLVHRRASLCARVFPAADPPWNTTVGIVWHDEGAWVHNARNKALFGAWTQGRLEPDVHRAGLHRPRVRVVRDRSGSACGRRGWCRSWRARVGRAARAAACAGIGGRDAGARSPARCSRPTTST